eukprot:739081-Hanusia_phi.AAC.4
MKCAVSLTFAASTPSKFFTTDSTRSCTSCFGRKPPLEKARTVKGWCGKRALTGAEKVRGRASCGRRRRRRMAEERSAGRSADMAARRCLAVGWSKRAVVGWVGVMRRVRCRQGGDGVGKGHGWGENTPTGGSLRVSGGPTPWGKKALVDESRGWGVGQRRRGDGWRDGVVVCQPYGSAVAKYPVPGTHRRQGGSSKGYEGKSTKGVGVPQGREGHDSKTLLANIKVHS